MGHAAIAAFCCLKNNVQIKVKHPGINTGEFVQCLPRVRAAETDGKREGEAKKSLKIHMKIVQMPQSSQFAGLVLMNTC
jgi:hypothetical protein